MVQSEEPMVAAKKETESTKENPQVSETEEVNGPAVSASEAPSAEPVPVAVVVAASDSPAKEPVEAEEVDEEEKEVTSPMARAFKNETISFLLVNQGAQLQAFVSQSENINYKPGELIGTFRKTSLPNVFRVSWKKPQEGREETTAYFDEEGNLNIDILKDGQIQVIKFEEIK